MTKLDKLDPENLSQAELAQIIGVDRTTVRAWTQKGMPYIRPRKRGQKARYNGPVCLNWWGGNRVAEKRGLRLTANEKIALGWMCPHLQYGLTSEDRRRYLKLMEYRGLDELEAMELLGFARGMFENRRP